MTSFSDLIERYTQAVRGATAALGEFTLFGLFERDDSPGHVDIIVAAPWLPTGRDGIVRVAQFLPKLGPGESAMIGSIVPLLPEDDFVRAATRLAANVSAGEVFETGSVPLAGLQVMRGYVLASHAGAGAKAAEPFAA